MRMSELMRDLPIESLDALDVSVSGIAHDSRRVQPGDLFVAWQGEQHDGLDYLAQARQRGAVAVLSSEPAPEQEGLVRFVSAEPRRLLGSLARRLYGRPDLELLHIGVTGTNGKSTVLELLASMLEAGGHPTGRVGTMGYRFEDLELAAERTTPEGDEYFQALRLMKDRGAEAVVAEVSSHALEQGRVSGGRFDLAVFTNLTQDHLDYHGSLESYFAAKRLLFDQLAPEGVAVVNLDDPFGRRLAEELPLTVGFGSGGAVSLEAASTDVTGSRGRVRTPRGVVDFRSALIGDFNLGNILAAVAAGEALGLPLEAVSDGIGACSPLSGRLEIVAEEEGVTVLVDFAHTEAALRSALNAARDLGDGRLIVVFGCGGDRDRTKRAPMGRAAGEMADLAILTSDNPRGEEPAAIAAEVEPGLAQAAPGRYLVELDRAKAIRTAIHEANAPAIVLVAGKGHERNQTIGTRVIPFSDHEEISKALEERRGSSTTG